VSSISYLPAAELQKLYFEMLRIRLIEEGIARLYAEQEMRCPVHLCVGQEAIAVGVCKALERDDWVMSSHRSHGHYLAKGGDLGRMLAELYGRETGCSGGNGGSMHLVDLSVGFLGATPIVASTIPILTGAAFAAKMRREPRVCVAFFGEGATEEGVFCETLNFAALHQLPVIFVCENNRYSVYSPLEVRQPAGRDLSLIARGHGVAYQSGDGNDVEAVLSVATKAVRRVRAGEGPTLLEFPTYRWREHCGPNFDLELPYRPQEEVAEWQARCPLIVAQQRMESAGVEFDLSAVTRNIEEEFAEAVAWAKASPYPDPAQLSSLVYAP
jgi:pyruvate dehydrogenase E1 component alpha subunit